MRESVKFNAEEGLAKSQQFIVKVFADITIALMVIAAVAYFIAIDPMMVGVIVENRFVFILLFVGPILVLYFSWIKKKVLQASSQGYIFYSILNGLALSVIFLVFTANSISIAFLITVGTFAIMSIVVYFTKNELTTIGNLLFNGLVISSVINIFIRMRLSIGLHPLWVFLFSSD